MSDLRLVTELAGLDHEAVAARMRHETFAGGPEDTGCEDPGVAALWTEVGTYMHGVCHLLAFHLHRETGMEVVVLEGRDAYGSWSMMHVAVTTSPREEILLAQADAETGLAVPVIDAVGAGDFADRLPLYPGALEYRMRLAGEGGVGYLEGMRTLEGDLVPGDPVARLPGLAAALGRPFDLQVALTAIVDGLDAQATWVIPDLEDLTAALGHDPSRSRRRPAFT